MSKMYIMATVPTRSSIRPSPFDSLACIVLVIVKLVIFLG